MDYLEFFQLTASSPQELRHVVADYLLDQNNESLANSTRLGWFFTPDYGGLEIICFFDETASLKQQRKLKAHWSMEADQDLRSQLNQGFYQELLEMYEIEEVHGENHCGESWGGGCGDGRGGSQL